VCEEAVVGGEPMEVEATTSTQRENVSEKQLFGNFGATRAT
jgi:hypothetical protein